MRAGILTGGRMLALNAVREVWMLPCCSRSKGSVHPLLTHAGEEILSIRQRGNCESGSVKKTVCLVRSLQAALAALRSMPRRKRAHLAVVLNQKALSDVPDL